MTHDHNEVRHALDGMRDEREWIFTFGFKHIHSGTQMRDRFVRIRGTFEDARAVMVQRFGKTWAFQYESEEEAGVQKFGLREYV